MSQMSMFEILELSEDSLRRVLPKASTRSLLQLVAAYPRTVGKNFLTLLEASVSAQTMTFIREQMLRSDLPSFGRIREAESELASIIESEHLIPDHRS